MVQKGSKCLQNGSIGSKLVQKNPICYKWLQMCLNGPASDPNCSKCSKWVLRGPKYGSNIIMNSIGWPLNPGLLGLVMSTITYGMCIGRLFQLHIIGGGGLTGKFIKTFSFISHEVVAYDNILKSAAQVLFSWLCLETVKLVNLHGYNSI